MTAEDRMLNWQTLARDYWGIELDPENIYARWSHEWAVHSGCIWNKRGIAGIKLLARYDANSGKYL